MKLFLMEIVNGSFKMLYSILLTWEKRLVN